MQWKDLIDFDERVSFLKEQINPRNKPLVNRSFEIQIEIIRNANIEGMAFPILQKKNLLKNANM